MSFPISAVFAACALVGAAVAPLPAAAHSDVRVQMNWGYPGGYPVVVYRTPYRHDDYDRYERYDHYGRPVVVYHYVDRPDYQHRHPRGHGHHRHDRYCRH